MPPNSQKTKKAAKKAIIYLIIIIGIFTFLNLAMFLLKTAYPIPSPHPRIIQKIPAK